MESTRPFLEAKKKLHIEVLLLVHNQLSQLKARKASWLDTHELINIIKLASRNYCFAEPLVIVYAAIILESSLTPTMTSNGALVFELRSDAVTEDLFIRSIVATLSAKSEGKSIAIDELIKDYSAYKHRIIQGRFNPVSFRVDATEFLARIRRFGFDLIFPAECYDKVLCCIYVTLQAHHDPISHRDIIEMVMVVKDSDRVPELKAVTKTKVRGILAILKHAEVFDTIKDLVDPVRMRLGKHVKKFEDLRAMHDRFLLRFAENNDLIMDPLAWNEFIWPSELGIKSQMLNKCNSFIQKLLIFFQRMESGNFACTQMLPEQLPSGNLPMTVDTLSYQVGSYSFDDSCGSYSSSSEDSLSPYYGGSIGLDQRFSFESTKIKMVSHFGNQSSVMAETIDAAVHKNMSSDYSADYTVGMAYSEDSKATGIINTSSHVDASLTVRDLASYNLFDRSCSSTTLSNAFFSGIVVGDWSNFEIDHSEAGQD